MCCHPPQPAAGVSLPQDYNSNMLHKSRTTLTPQTHVRKTEQVEKVAWPSPRKHRRKSPCCWHRHGTTLPGDGFGLTTSNSSAKGFRDNTNKKEQPRARQHSAGHAANSSWSSSSNFVFWCFMLTCCASRHRDRASSRHARGHKGHCLSTMRLATILPPRTQRLWFLIRCSKSHAGTPPLPSWHGLWLQ